MLHHRSGEASWAKNGALKDPLFRTFSSSTVLSSYMSIVNSRGDVGIYEK